MVKWKDTLEKDLGLLLEDVCVRFGFCDRPSAAEIIQHDGTVTASLFADAVLASEGMNPEYETEWRTVLAQRFIEWFGGDRASAADYPRPGRSVPTD